MMDWTACSRIMEQNSEDENQNSIHVELGQAVERYFCFLDATFTFNGQTAQCLFFFNELLPSMSGN